MEFFNLFDSYKLDDTIEKLIDNISNYDVFDFISRVSGLNLISENQNKSVLTDTLIQNLISKNIDSYHSTTKMSDKGFRNIIEGLNMSYLSDSVDPCENTYVQNVMFNSRNYRMFNGIDVTPSYNLQIMIRVLFGYKNNYNPEYLNKTNAMLSLILGISEEIAKITDSRVDNAHYDDGRKIIIPSGKTIRKNAEYTIFPIKRIERYINGAFPIEELITEFGIPDCGSIDNRPFYSKPFIKDAHNENIILLNVSLLPAFALYKVLDWATQYNIKSDILDKYNEYAWIELLKTMDSLGHHKIKETEYGVNCLTNNYYKEAILTANNSQLIFLFFFCDNGDAYSKDNIHSKFPDNRHQILLKKRLCYFQNCFDKLEIASDDTFSIMSINNIGRSVGVKVNHNPFGHKIIKLNPFEIHCIGINERNNGSFLTRYIRAKSQLNTTALELFSELNAVSLYTENHNSFYISDDINPNNYSISFISGDSVDYITKALTSENRILIDSYVDGSKTEVILANKPRNIYIEDRLFRENNIAFCVSYENILLWIKTDNILNDSQINIYYSLIDAISYWLSECKDIIETFDFPFSVYSIHISLIGDLNEYYFAQDVSTPFEECIESSIEHTHISLMFSPKAYSNFNQTDNSQERLLCCYIMNLLSRFALNSIDYSLMINDVFRNPLKKKFFSGSYEKTPYFKPLKVTHNRKILIEDEDYISGIIGKELLKTGNWSIGDINNSQRTLLANEVVTLLYNRLKNMVAELNPEFFLEMIYQDLEEVLYNLMLAEQRFYSDVACYPENEDKYIQEYNRLNKTSIALKFLAEYATAVPCSGSIRFSIAYYEELLAICAMIIDWAYKGDLFKFDMIDTHVEFLKSQRIGMEHDRFEELYNYNDIYRRRRLKYNSSYSLRKIHIVSTQNFDAELENAFISEFGYSYSEFVKAIAALVYINKNDVIVINKTDAISRIRAEYTDISESLITKVLEDIIYKPRLDYLVLPKTYSKEDAYPWRFNRVYSFNRRPILQRDNSLIWGNRQLFSMLEYLTDLIYSGKIKAHSIQMKELCGKITKSKGNEFNRLVVEIIKDMQANFIIIPNVKKVNGKRITENKLDLGDIDILLIDNQNKKIYSIEVKNFKYSRNPYEIHREYEAMFVDGKKPCFVTKHNKRTNWIKDHIDDVKTEYGLNGEKWEIISLFIVSQSLISNSFYDQNINCISIDELSLEKLTSLL